MQQTKKTNSKLKKVNNHNRTIYIIIVIQIKLSKTRTILYYNCSTFPKCKHTRNVFVFNLLDFSAASDSIYCFFSVENPEILQGFFVLISPLNIWHLWALSCSSYSIFLWWWSTFIISAFVFSPASVSSIQLGCWTA